MFPQRHVPPPTRAGKHHLHFENRTLIMGVVNVTPDSFSDGGNSARVEDAVEHALQLVEEGADLLDIGGESTRPGAASVTVETELARVLPVIRALAVRVGVPISVDTRNAATARAALEAGAWMVNDVSAGTHDPEMLRACAETGAPITLMHMRGTPADMQRGLIHYDDVVAEVVAYLRVRVDATVAAGIPRERCWVDPGFGFGKNAEHNLALLRGLPELCALGVPVLWGPSRKATLGWLTGGLPPPWRVHGTVAACVMAVERGAHVVRVHDVAAVRQALAVTDAVRGVYIAP